MQRSISLSLAVSIMAVGLVTGAANGETDFSKFPLLRAVPADAFITVAARHNGERKFLNDYWCDVTQAFMDSGIMSDVWDLVVEDVPDEDLAEFEETTEHFMEVIKKVEWGRLFEKEMIYTARFGDVGPAFYQGLLAGRLDKKSTEKNYDGLKEIMEEVRKLIEAEAGEGAVEILESTEKGVKIASLGPVGGAAQMGVGVAIKGDILLLGLGGQGMLHDALDLLGKSSEKARLADAPRFKKAFAQLPAAEDELVFFDVDAMFGALERMIRMIAMMTSPPPGPDGQPPEVSPGVKAIMRLMKDIRIFEYVAAVQWTEGFRVFSDSVTSLKEDAKSSPIYGLLTSGESLENFQAYVPKETQSFYVSSGMKLSLVYDYAITFVKDVIPDGPSMIASFEQMQKEQWELDIKKDVLDLFEGQWASIAMGDNWVIMAKVTDENAMEKQVARLLSAINGALGPENSVVIKEVKVGAKSTFKQLSHPMMAMMPGFSPPVLGCCDGYFFIGSSAKTLKKCIMTAAGDHPDITKSARWRAEAIAPTTAVTSISFTDESNLAAELQEGVAGLSMGLGMAGMMGGQGMPPEVRKVFSTLPPLLAKLSPVLGKLDFFQSSASFDTFDGRRWHTRAVQNYKDPATLERETEDEEEPENEDEEKMAL